jgi:hypothetical protein
MAAAAAAALADIILRCPKAVTHGLLLEIPSGKALHVEC